MFINCPHCGALVATDPATDTPPERCPRCAVALRTPREESASTGSSPDAASPEAAITIAVPAITDIDTSLEEIEQAPVATPGDEAATQSLPAATAPSFSAEIPEPLADPRDESEGVVATEIPSGLPNRTPDAASAEAASALPDTDPETHSDDEVLAADAEAAAALEPEADTVIADPANATTPPSIPRTARHAPSFARAQGTRTTVTAKRAWRDAIAIVLLGLLLALQLLLADRTELAANARWRPWITSLCSALRCTVPPWREAEAFTLLERDVRPHPAVPGALRVTASFRNDARWPQPWPRLVLTLSDIEGREVGTRSFSAMEYLGAAPTQNQLNSGQTATIAMDVVEPAPRIVAFTFAFQ
jgi:Protein of unknown function (DUF3426)